ncbi:MAG: thioredoxin family protein [[Eubacterium] siraeum]
MNIKILGGGCASCKKLYENTLKAVEEKGMVAEVEYITDMPKVMEYGVMSMPVLVVEEKIAAQGKVLKTAEIVKLLGKMGF